VHFTDKEQLSVGVLPLAPASLRRKKRKTRYLKMRLPRKRKEIEGKKATKKKKATRRQEEEKGNKKKKERGKKTKDMLILQQRGCDVGNENRL
jgi:hypothetical protein